MGELPCLRRSFSQPSGGLREGDPLRALCESVSFGRFMTDSSLGWEKWSAFSHNRYLEEVEKFAKPGSVAEKKAYFEAHYKRKAAERAAALLEAANVVATCTIAKPQPPPPLPPPPPPLIEDKKFDDFSTDSDVVKEESRVDEQREKDVTVSPGNSNSSVERDESDISKLEGAVVVTRENIDSENSNPVEIAKLSKNNEHNKIDSTTEENILASEEMIASSSKKRSSTSSSKSSSSQSKVSKTSLSPAKQTTCVQSVKENNLASRSKNLMEDMINKRSAKSFHMSIHLSSHPGGESSKTTSPVIQKIKSLKNFTASLSVYKNTSAISQTKTKASINELKRPTLNFRPEDRSDKLLVNKSVAGRIAAYQKQNSPSKENSISPNGKGRKPRPSIITSPFGLRSEERAAKRKEFYEKLEQKRNAEEAEKKHSQARYQDLKKVRQSTGLKAKQKEGLCPGSQLSTTHIKKIPSTRPRSPLLGKKATTSKISDATSRPSANTESSKCIGNKRSTNWSVTSHLQKNARENASPNIQNSVLKR